MRERARLPWLNYAAAALLAAYVLPPGGGGWLWLRKPRLSPAASRRLW